MMTTSFPAVEISDRKFQSITFNSERPADVTAMIDRVGQRVERTPAFKIHKNSAFAVVKAKTDYCYGKHSLGSILKHLLSKKTGTINVLDLGCGSGGVLLRMTFLFWDRVRIIGVDMVNSDELPDSRFIQGNIERLLEIDALKSQKFDLVCSSGVFNRLIDPLGALSFAYEKVKRGGLLLVDEVTLPGVIGAEHALLMDLRKNKYSLSAGVYEQRGFAYLMFQKTEKHLRWPVAYDRCSFNGATYMVERHLLYTEVIDGAPTEEKTTATQA
jgi:SAM-dependent methyltransferase